MAHQRGDFSFYFQGQHLQAISDDPRQQPPESQPPPIEAALKAGLFPELEIDRTDRFRALIDRFISIITFNRSISIERPSQSIDIDRSYRSDRASRDKATKLLKSANHLGSSVAAARLATGNLAFFGTMGPYCDVCLADRREVYYHCSVCINGYFDICSHCQKVGALCFVKSHILHTYGQGSVAYDSSS
ncbi:hypothetical protein F5883DRAFT_125441 [Diaporthe sp. PMI_573]|nr:hypothetical protein F5883DRAFT_125441 [Diaporthaceae sp. PMI_573]